MFNLQSEVQRLQLLEHAKVHGLLNKPKQSNPEIPHIDDTVYNGQAKEEGIAISRCFKSRTMDFGKRLIKSKGHKHHPGGGFAGHAEIT